VDDLAAICEANHMCNCGGIDTISASTTIAFAMECYEKGILKKDDLGGIDLEWGNSKAMLELLQKMIDREGIGHILADGVKLAADRIGKESHKYAMHVGGQEMGFHDPRIDPGFGIAYQCEPTPGRHTIAAFGYQELLDLHKLFPEESIESLPHIISKKWKHKEEGKAKLQAVNSKFTQVLSSAGLCELGGLAAGPHFPIMKWMNAATGWDFSNEEYLKAGERIETMRQAFNVREEIGSFKLPDRLLSLQTVNTGPFKDVKLNLSQIKKDFYREFSWNEKTATPSDEVLEELGLVDVASALKK
jgi:aldehyde:ferredoxin oxidoreductase